MHDSHEDRTLHIEMVKEDHPSLYSYIRYDETKHQTKKKNKKKKE